MIQAAFFDIDGTLLDPEDGGRMPASTLAALRALRARGIKTYIATGRDASMLAPLKALFPFDGYIASNGQNILDDTGAPYPTLTHDPADIRALLELAKTRWMSIMICEKGGTFPVADDEVNRRLYRWLGTEMPPLYDPARLAEHPVVQFTVCLTPELAGGLRGQRALEEGRELLRVLPGVEVTSAGGGILDCVPKGGGKEVGIAMVCQRLGVRREDTVVFGDGANDIRMLRWAGTGVAMGNAPANVQSQADYVTAPVGQDGIWQALSRLGVLEERG